ncbi:phosphonate metabolism transcriptional regulator PhnF [Sinorhizobium terangae]|uniref:phosphonate metabolism transcriptional regulator PhnF n=1 Tax=Sinorhizobium terangae TaxID=110322 RepID=UPI0024B12AD4|nr:phosphonate metabolism transcriptional regulator PhnF [Sinorhizobium terangae]WFU51749.1 phosphonate metabolism transcriptional regulator PhnF [Sinorhizobium terangae]
MSNEMKPNDGQKTRGRRRGLVVWKQIEAVLAEELIAGKYPAGSKLPTEPELMARFNVGRHTLRQTMSELEAKGLVRIEQGRGTFVHEQVIHYRISERTRFTQNLKDQQLEANYRITGSETIAAPEEVRAALSLSNDELVTRIFVDSYAGRVIIALSEVYFSATRFPDVARVYAELKSTTDTYRSFGINDYMRRTTRISSRPPTEDEARRLFQPTSRPVLITRKVDVDLELHPISYSETRWSSDRVELVVEDL